MGTSRPYDIVLFGATGFTGGLTAEYLARHAPEGCRWALAGRDPAKLERVRERLAALDPACASLPLLTAEVAQADTLRDFAARTRVVISTVGPYLRYGEPLVAACAEVGTDYVDLTGEPEFVDLMYLKHHRAAVASGARIVHSCGFDSLPYDLGALLTVRQLPSDAPVFVEGFVRAAGTVSGGTVASALMAVSRPLAMVRAARHRRAAEPTPAGRRSRAVLRGPRWSADARAWTLPMPTIDPMVVTRSATALDDYGPDFRYAHNAAVKWLPVALVGGVGVVAALAAAQLPPVRRALEHTRKPGEGPDERRRAKGWFTVRFAGRSGKERVWTEVSGGDPGYGATSLMLAESALSLAFDDLPVTAGQLTPAAAMGTALIDRLTAAGMRFAVLQAPPRSAPGRWKG
ncbi:saccharopine dehydrogenase NADP-binding domain-containing protein [Streptomyces sp. PTM05]|uniref:Saccharopine dehydrogenase NADP-binding domain-containing protein n=1 Tax=Streptantibioticus parmotrematis TaxID=2873249 RepID=A0ABS7QJS5_9ACTN|nr:saccharopine dehydrogenase NADP-binding domain-containing protein [Streptantibioticus parmotrematis]MBY8883416.1 saccharopine dehydrogenase NADP-binding domain-containing protein [Streptantibioticus parmotrematis]